MMAHKVQENILIEFFYSTGWCLNFDQRTHVNSLSHSRGKNFDDFCGRSKFHFRHKSSTSADMDELLIFHGKFHINSSNFSVIFSRRETAEFTWAMNQQLNKYSRQVSRTKSLYSVIWFLRQTRNDVIRSSKILIALVFNFILCFFYHSMLNLRHTKLPKKKIKQRKKPHFLKN